MHTRDHFTEFRIPRPEIVRHNGHVSRGYDSDGDLAREHRSYPSTSTNQHNNTSSNGRMSYYHAGAGGGAMNPAYHGSGEKYRDHTLQMPVTTSVIREAPRWSWCSTVWSVIALCCCGSWCGFLGLLCSIFSYTDHKAGDYDRSSYKRRWSWGCTVTGLILALLVIIAIIVVIFAFSKEFEKWCNSQYNCNINV